MDTSRTPQFYFANLGSEIVGIYSAKSRGDKTQIGHCYTRAKKIIEDFRQVETRDSAILEIEAILQVIDDLVSQDSQLKVSKSDIESYF